tara:strand:+ start:1163 stop:1282 length:120 start_codon:yes stop_codon:yes gene_type:complete
MALQMLVHLGCPMTVHAAHPVTQLMSQEHLRRDGWQIRQ